MCLRMCEAGPEDKIFSVQFDKTVEDATCLPGVIDV